MDYFWGGTLKTFYLLVLEKEEGRRKKGTEGGEKDKETHTNTSLLFCLLMRSRVGSCMCCD